jgi:cobalamin-dependent methionine synthase I
MGSIFDYKGKKTEEILDQMFNLVGGVDYPIFEALKAAIQVKTTDQVLHTIDEGRKDFINMIGVLRTSIDQFKKSSERTSKALIALTAVIGFATLVQAFYAIMLILKK